MESDTEGLGLDTERRGTLKQRLPKLSLILCITVYLQSVSSEYRLAILTDDRIAFCLAVLGEATVMNLWGHWMTQSTMCNSMSRETREALDQLQVTSRYEW